MEVQTDFTHPLKLNCSSIASSTPGNNASFPNGDIIKFEQFDNISSLDQSDKTIFAHKKRLTIEINDSYDFNQSSVDHSAYEPQIQSVTQKESLSGNFFKKNQKDLQICISDSQSPSFANSNSDIDLNKLLSFNSFLQDKNKDLQQENAELKTQLDSQKSQNKYLKTEIDSLKNALKKRQEIIFAEKQRNNKLTQKIAQLEEKKAEHDFYDQKLREKENKIAEMQRKLQKVTNMNKNLQKQLKQSERKIMQLEKELQKAFCQNQHEMISRIKQSSVKVKEASLKSKELVCNKQNQNNNMATGNMGNTMASTIQMRKSIDKKNKCSQSQGKKKQQPTIPVKIQQSAIRAQRASSSSNIVSKKLLVMKKE